MKETIPTVTKNHKPHNPWWNEDCQKRIKERNKAKNKAIKYKTKDYLYEYLNKKALAQKTIREAKRQHWNKYCSRLNRFTPTSEIWKMIKRYNNIIQKKECLPTLKENDIEYITDQKKVNKIAEDYTYVTKHKVDPSSQLYTHVANNIEKIKNKEPDNNFPSVLNDNFTLSELEAAIQRQNSSSTPGHDKIKYLIYQKLTKSAKQTMLNLINQIWSSGQNTKAMQTLNYYPNQKT